MSSSSSPLSLNSPRSQRTLEEVLASFGADERVNFPTLKFSPLRHAIHVYSGSNKLESFFSKYHSFSVKNQTLLLFWSKRGYRPARDRFRLRIHGIDSKGERDLLANALVFDFPYRSYISLPLPLPISYIVFCNQQMRKLQHIRVRHDSPLALVLTYLKAD